MRNRRKAISDIRFRHPPPTPPGLIHEHLQGIVLAPLRAKPETARGKVRLKDRLEHDLQRGVHDAVTHRGNRERSLLGRSRLGDIHPPRRKHPIRPLPQFAGQFIKEPVDAVLPFDPVHSGPVNTRCAVVTAHRDPRAPQDVSAQDLVPKRMKPSPGIGLGRPVQRVLQSTHLIHRNRVNDTGSAVGRASTNGTHRAPPQSIARIDEAVALPLPAVMLSTRLDRYYGHLRRPPGCLPLPSSSLVIGRTAPTKTAQSAGPGRASPVPAATIRTFRALYAGESFTAALPGSSPLPWPSPFCTGLGTPSPHPHG